MKDLKCCKCKQVIKGGFYNAPSGAHCCQCWDKMPQKSKDNAFVETLKCLAAVGASINKMKIN